MSVNTITAFLTQISACRAKLEFKMPKDWDYTCIEDFVLRNGRAFIPDVLPKEHQHGKLRECFMNAATLALAYPNEYTYVEGYALAKGIPFPVHHAWVVTKGGVVVDNTWKPVGTAYYGVEFKATFLAKRLLAQETYGLLDDWPNKWPLLRGIFKPKEWEV